MPNKSVLMSSKKGEIAVLEEYHYSVKEVAKILNMSVPGVHRLIQTKQLGAHRFSERRTRISETDLNDFLRRTRVGGPTLENRIKLEIGCDCE